MPSENGLIFHAWFSVKRGVLALDSNRNAFLHYKPRCKKTNMESYTLL